MCCRRSLPPPDRGHSPRLRRPRSALPHPLVQYLPPLAGDTSASACARLPPEFTGIHHTAVHLRVAHSRELNQRLYVCVGRGGAGSSGAGGESWLKGVTGMEERTITLASTVRPLPWFIRYSVLHALLAQVFPALLRLHLRRPSRSSRLSSVWPTSQSSCCSSDWWRVTTMAASGAACAAACAPRCAC